MTCRLQNSSRTVALASFMLLALACGEPASQPPTPSADSPAAQASPEDGVRSYVVRARVARLNTRADPPLLHLQHESIPDFVGPEGEVDGMKSMLMPFPLAEGVELDGVAVNDVIEFDLKVDWNAVLPARITAIRPLPADTRLAFDSAREP